MPPVVRATRAGLESAVSATVVQFDARALAWRGFRIASSSGVAIAARIWPLAMIMRLAQRVAEAFATHSSRAFERGVSPMSFDESV